MTTAKPTESQQLDQLSHDLGIQFAYPNSDKIYLTGSRADMRVPLREIRQDDTMSAQGSEPNPPIPVYDTSGPYGDLNAEINLKQGLADVRVLDELLPVITNGACPLSENQEFMDSLRKLDELQADGGGVSATVPLCLICVFAFENKFADGRNWLAPELEDELADLVHDCFLHLAVPRKEKMRIEDTVSLAIRIVNAAEGSKLPKQILKNPALVDVVPLLTCLGSPAVELLKGLKYDNSDREGQRDRRRTRGQRYPRRRRFSPTKSQRL